MAPPDSPIPTPRDNLTASVDRFYETLHATTIPFENGGRRVDGYYHAMALSQACDDLYRTMSEMMECLFHAHSDPVEGLPPGIEFVMSDSASGPWEPVPIGKFGPRRLRVGRDGADPALMAALTSATTVVAFEADDWNERQAKTPGANHPRWHAGDVLTAEDLAKLESVRKLLRLGDGGAMTTNAGPAAEPPRRLTPFEHAMDFTWVRWNGTLHRFAPGQQAAAVGLLWDSWEQSNRTDGCGLGESAIAEAIDSGASDFRLAHVFRGHPAWGSMIRSAGRGVFALFSQPPKNHTS
jgi:hypothetical protein